jgi:glycosyltransferase involved in cell wall biosynthesis
VPTVSVVIPTRQRGELLQRAVGSALAQSHQDIEVIVVVDGPDDESGPALERFADPRVRVVQHDDRKGAPAARNTGAAAANGEWVALLDDDDEWLPDKLATQLALAKDSPYRVPIVASRLTVRTPRTDFVLPRRLPDPGEPISEYLAVRRGPFHGEGFIQTSTIMAPTELFRQVPFDEGLRRLQELDWTLRCVEHDDGVGLVFAPDPLVIWYADENRQRITFDAPWREQLEWLRASRNRVTPRAYAAIAMSVVSSMAAPTHSPRVFGTLLREAVRHGRPGAMDYVTFLQVWLVPPGLRRKVRDLVLGRRERRAARSTA